MFGKRRRRQAALDEQAENDAVIQRPPRAVVLHVVDNGPEHGRKWLCWEHDPDHEKLHAGAIDGIVVPYGMQAGFENAPLAVLSGLAAVRDGGWTGDVVLRGWSDAV